jgi:hypothetical protein
MELVGGCDVILEVANRNFRIFRIRMDGPPPQNRVRILYFQKKLINSMPNDVLVSRLNLTRSDGIGRL